MEEKKATNNNEILQPNLKMEWEAPKLYSLDKGKTEGGASTGNTTEGPSYTYKGS